jgi:predicted outer membrane lipoprotein
VTNTATEIKVYVGQTCFVSSRNGNRAKLSSLIWECIKFLFCFYLKLLDLSRGFLIVCACAVSLNALWYERCTGSTNRDRYRLSTVAGNTETRSVS